MELSYYKFKILVFGPFGCKQYIFASLTRLDVASKPKTGEIKICYDINPNQHLCV